MDILLKLSAEQKGLLLQELLSFLLAKNGKSKKDDVLSYFLGKNQLSRINLEENDFLDLIKALFSMCVKAEWTKQTTFWKITLHGVKAHERFKSPKNLFKEMAVQAIIRQEDRAKAKLNINRKLAFFSISALGILCIFFYLSLDNIHIFILGICAIVSVVLSIFLSESRTRLIILGRLLFLEFLVLGATIVFGAIFQSTSLGKFFEIYFWGTVFSQIFFIVAVFVYPLSFVSFHNYINNYINRNMKIIGILIMIMLLLFGNQYSKGRGFIYLVLGDDINKIFFCLFLVGAICFGVVYLLSGVASNLSRVGYYD